MHIAHFTELLSPSGRDCWTRKTGGQRAYMVTEKESRCSLLQYLESQSWLRISRIGLLDIDSSSMESDVSLRFLLKRPTRNQCLYPNGATEVIPQDWDL